MTDGNIPKEIAWEILQACILWYEGADPEFYGCRKEEARIGKQLADALYLRVEKLIGYYKQIGLLEGGQTNNLKWRRRK